MTEIKNKQFKYVHGFKENEGIRHSFNALTQRIYGFDFEKWYQDGYWPDSYIPHSLLFENNVVANTSVSLIDFELFGKKRRYLQIGTVMTAPESRGIGLSRFLMEKIMAEWKDKCDLIYLFANDSVLSFYPQFGFEKADEYQLSKELAGSNYPIAPPAFTKVAMDDERNRLLITEKIKRAKSCSQLFMAGNAGLVMFYLTSFLKENVYYLEKYDAYVIFEIDGNVIYLQDIFCEAEIKLDEILSLLITKDIKKIVLGFTPIESQAFAKSLLQEEDTTLFIYGRDAEHFRTSQVMFPVLSHT
ncbi:MAG: GNAT family N-acetyltransferase [Lachnospiraceae bacterium]|nr:GNAT family N-acetyltransferase [Lachnospiraceae bacterium]